MKHIITAALIAAALTVTPQPAQAADPPTPTEQTERHARCTSGPYTIRSGLGHIEGASIKCTTRHSYYVEVSCRYWDVWTWKWRYTTRNDTARAPFTADARCPRRWDRTGHSYRVWAW